MRLHTMECIALYNFSMVSRYCRMYDTEKLSSPAEVCYILQQRCATHFDTAGAAFCFLFKSKMCATQVGV